MKLQLGLLLLLVSSFQKITRQDGSVLTSKIEIEAANESIFSILQKIETQTSLYFSYDSKTINTEKKITISVKAKTLSQAISLIFNGTVRYKVKGNCIILYKATPVKENSTNMGVTQIRNTISKKNNLPTSIKSDSLPQLQLKDSIKNSDHFTDKPNTATHTDTILINNEELIYPQLRLINDDTTILILEEEPLETR